MNKSHYTLAARISHCKSVLAGQRRGAKIHINNVKLPLESLDLLRLKEGEKAPKFTYGVISVEDAIADLERWDFLTISTLMQRPFDVVQGHDELLEKQRTNLKSALAFAALTTPGNRDRDLYQSIVNLAHCQSK